MYIYIQVGAFFYLRGNCIYYSAQHTHNMPFFFSFLFFVLIDVICLLVFQEYFNGFYQVLSLQFLFFLFYSFNICFFFKVFFSPPFILVLISLAFLVNSCFLLRKTLPRENSNIIRICFSHK